MMNPVMTFKTNPKPMKAIIKPFPKSSLFMVNLGCLSFLAHLAIWVKVKVFQPKA